MPALNTETNLKSNIIYCLFPDMVLTKDIWLPTDAELTVEEIPLGTPSLRAGAMHLGKYCEAKNNDFMLCRNETQDPRCGV